MIERVMNALIALVIASVLLGAFAFQFIKNEEPCPLCLLQRVGMLGVCMGALMNVRFGPSTTHYGMMLLSCFFGGFVALRQIFLHVCPGFPLFGVPFWGLSLYTWSFLVFVSTVVAVALLLFLHDAKKAMAGQNGADRLDRTALWLLFLIALGNVAATLAQCGLGPCVD